MVDGQDELKHTRIYLKELYKDLEKKLKRYKKKNLTEKEKDRRLKKLKDKIIHVLIRIEELSESKH